MATDGSSTAVHAGVTIGKVGGGPRRVVSADDSTGSAADGAPAAAASDEFTALEDWLLTQGAGGCAFPQLHMKSYGSNGRGVHCRYVARESAPLPLSATPPYARGGCREEIVISSGNTAFCKRGCALHFGCVTERRCHASEDVGCVEVARHGCKTCLLARQTAAEFGAPLRESWACPAAVDGLLLCPSASCCRSCCYRRISFPLLSHSRVR
jgi:hypothetical protein